MKITKTTLKIISIIAGLLAIAFVILGLCKIDGDIAGWVQSAISVIEIPIIFFGISRILKEIQVKPELDYGFFSNKVPEDLDDYLNKPLPKNLTCQGYPAKVYFVVFNKGKLSAEKISVVLRYENFEKPCHPFIHDPSDISALIQNRITNEKKLEGSFEIITPRNHEHIHFEIHPNFNRKCDDSRKSSWSLVFSIDIYSKELQSPISGKLNIDIGPYVS